MGMANASPTDSFSPRGGEVAISQENDLITFVKYSGVDRLIASLSTVNGIRLDRVPLQESFRVYFGS